MNHGGLLPPPPPHRHTSGFRFGSDQGAVSEDSVNSKHFDIGECPSPPPYCRSPSLPGTGHGEGTSSIAWLPGQPNCLIAGMGTRFLRLFDTRDSQPSPTHAAAAPREVANHKAINGLCMDPNSAHQLATYGEGGTVYIWDIRQFSRPVSPTYQCTCGNS